MLRTISLKRPLTFSSRLGGIAGGGLGGEGGCGGGSGGDGGGNGGDGGDGGGDGGGGDGGDGGANGTTKEWLPECPHPSVMSFCPRPDHVASSQPLPHKSCIERVQVERGGRSRLYVCTLSSWLYHVP